MESILHGTYIIAAVIVFFGFTIFVHEFGHFLAARLCGLVIDKFAIGFGPAIWRREHKGVIYQIGCIPVGGFVALPQLDPSGMRVVQGQTEPGQPAQPGEARKPEAGARVLPQVAPWRRIIVTLSGAAGNIALAVILAWVVYLNQKPSLVGETSGGAMVGKVDPSSVAFERGLRPGDKILTVNGKTVKTWMELMQIASLGDQVTLQVTSEGDAQPRDITLPTTNDPTLHLLLVPGIEEGSICRVRVIQPGSPAERAGLKSADVIRALDGIQVFSREDMVTQLQNYSNRQVIATIDRHGQLMDVRVNPIYDRTASRVRIGVEFDPMVMTPWEQLKYDATGIVRILRALVTPKQAKHAAEGLGGPVSIFAMLWLYLQVGFIQALGFIRFLNVNLGILNLLPIPVLDGGHIVFSLWEMITRRPVHEKVASWLVNIFAALLIGALVLLTYRDVFRWWAIRQDMKANRADVTNAVPESEPQSQPAPGR